MNARCFLPLGAQGAHQAPVARPSPNEADVVVLAPRHDGVAAASRISPAVEPRLGKVTANRQDEAPPFFEATRRGVLARWRPPGAPKRLAAEDVERQVTVATGVAMKEPAFLGTVQRVIGRIEVEPSLARGPRMRFHQELDQQLIEGLRTRDDALVAVRRRRLGVAEFQAVERARTGQRLAAVALSNARVARHIPFAHQQRQSGVGTQVVMIVEVFLTEPDGLEALRHQFMHVGLDARWMTGIDKALRYARRDPNALIDLPQETAAGVRTDASAVESTRHRTSSQGVKLKLFAATLCLHGCFLLSVA